MNARTLQASKIVDRIVGGWRGAPPVTVVSNTTDLPVPAYADVRGMWRPGEVFIVANQPLDLVGDTLAHEALGHCGLRETLGRHWRGFMFGVQYGARSGDGRLRCFRDEVRGIYVDESGACNLSPVLEADEICAAVVESRFHSPSGRLRVQQPLRKLMLAAGGHISREVLYRDKPVDFDQLLGTILISEHRLRHGGLFFGLGWRLRGWYAPPMPAPKPLDRYTPPMSLRESEWLLEQEADRIRKKEDSKASWSAIGGLLAIFVGLPLCIIAMASGILDFLRMIFR